MSIRKIVKIDEEKCNGCGLCVPNCAEGAIQIIGGKAKLVKDSYCDGLGACLGHCPMDAIHIIEREADEFNEEEAMKFVNSLNKKKVNPVLEETPHKGGCPGTKMRMLNRDRDGGSNSINTKDVEINIKPQLAQWPVQLKLVPTKAPFFENSHLLVTADCVPFAYANYHLELLKGKSLVIGCPKLDNIDYAEKLTVIIRDNNIKSITVAHMEVPCCSGIIRAVEEALKGSGKDIPIYKIRVGIDGTITKYGDQPT